MKRLLIVHLISGLKALSPVTKLNKLSLITAAFSVLTLSAHAGSASFTNIEQMTGWGSCTACAGGGESATYSMKRPISSPSLDGASAKFSIGGTVPFSHGLWWRRMSSDGTASRFVLDMYYYMKNPSSSQGLEFAANQSMGGKWYKFSTQCSFARKIWRVWDSANRKWVSTSLACNRPAAYKWNHVTFEYARQDGKAKFVSITVNGKKTYLNKGFWPRSNHAGTSTGIHFQLNGNSTQTDYSVWADRLSFKHW
jgi:hypothetical protein